MRSVVDLEEARSFESVFRMRGAETRKAIQSRALACLRSSMDRTRTS